MKCCTSTTVVVCMVMWLCMAATIQAHQGESDNNRTLSPYFLVISDDADMDQLPLKSTLVDVDISGVIADVHIRQVYENRGDKPLEAIYVFPASTRAAVYGMKMAIGERTIVADIRTREAARQEYEQAKQDGRSASLLEQHRPNVFQMNVANILPSDVIEVELFYTELLIPLDSIYEFVYPTVVGPRYSNQSADEADPDDRWVENPYLHEGQFAAYTFDIRMNLYAGMPIQDIVCTSHTTTINYEGKSFATVELDESENAGGDRDFICKYRLSGSSIETGLLLYEGVEENFFLTMMQPPQKVRADQIPPREYIFIVDVSGSMHGFPLDVTKALLKDLIGGLRGSDTFNVLLFSGGSSVLAEQSLPATKKNITHALELIDRQRGGGGTELLPALKRALGLPSSEGRSRTVIIATDGYVSVEKESFDLIRNNLGEANMFAFGIGSSVNRYIIEGMARAGMGEPLVVTKPEEAPGVAAAFRKLLANPILTDITLSFDGFDTYDVEPLSVPDVFAGRPVIVFGKWRGTPKGIIRIQGIFGHEVFTSEIDVSASSALEENSALKYLWARHRIAMLSDYTRLGQDDERTSEIKSLGLMYHLLTEYTSFVAVDSQVRLPGGGTVTVRQPLPLPQGVSGYAVGGGVRSAKMCAPAMQLYSVAADEVICKEAQIGHERNKDKDGSASSDGTVPGIHMEIREISVKGGLNKAEVKRIISGSIPLMEQCAKDMQGGTELSYTLVLDAGGRVKEIRADKEHSMKKETNDCIIKLLRQIRFPSSRDILDKQIRLVLVVKENVKQG